MIKVLLVEDHKLMRVGLKSLFEETGEIEVVSEAQTGKEAIEKYKIVHPEVVLMDIGLPDISGIEAAKRGGMYAIAVGAAENNPNADISVKSIDSLYKILILLKWREYIMVEFTLSEKQFNEDNPQEVWNDVAN